MRRFIPVALLPLLALASQPSEAACSHVSTTWTCTDEGSPTTNGTSLQAAFDAMVAGETVILTAGVEFRRGGFTIPNVTGGTATVTIRSSSTSSLPSGRIVGATHASLLAKVTNSSDSVPAITFASGSHDILIDGLEITTVSGLSASYGDLVRSPETVAYDSWPKRITIQRSWIHPYETGATDLYTSVSRGVRIDGESITIKWNDISGFGPWDYGATQSNVTAATNANPVVITLSETIGDPGRKVVMVFAGATGNWTGLNGAKIMTWVSSTTWSMQDFDASFTLTNVNTTSAGSFSGQSPTRRTTPGSASGALWITAGPGPYTIEDNLLEGYFAPMFWGGATSTYYPAANDVTVTSVGAIDQVTLSGVGNLAVNDLIAFGTQQDQTISTATAGSPTSLTVQTHRFPAGTILGPFGTIEISGFTGAWAALNGNRVGTVVDATHITVAVDSSAFGAVTGSAMKYILRTWNATSTQWSVGKVTNIAGSVVTFSWWGHQPENTHGHGTGILVASGSQAVFNGRNLDGVTVRKNTIGPRRYWVWAVRDQAKTCNTCSSQIVKGGVVEAKIGNNVLFEGNRLGVIGGSLDPYDGVSSIHINHSQQGGRDPWINTKTWDIRNNLFVGMAGPILSMNEEYLSGQVGGTVTVTNNLFTHALSEGVWIFGGDAWTITHNTIRNKGPHSGYRAFAIINGTVTNATFKDNIVNYDIYGYLVQSSWSPTRSNNFLIDEESQSFTPPTGDTRVATVAAMGFTDATSADAGGDYHGYKLTAGSVGHNAASDGTDVGVNFATLDAALGGVVSTITAPGGFTIRGGVGLP